MGGRYHQKYYTFEMNGYKQKSFITNTNESSCLEMLEPNVVIWLDKTRNDLFKFEMIHLIVYSLGILRVQKSPYVAATLGDIGQLKAT
jgi:hypothetical protein